MLSTILLIIGLVLILFGANYLTDGASAIVKRFGLSDLIVGLTIIAFGTSAPELAISLISSLQGSTGIAIGNAVGSNIFNILMIIGIVAMVKPIKVEKSIMVNEIPLVILSSIAILALGLSPVLGGGPAIITRSDAILLLLFFAIFMRYVFASAKSAESPLLTPESPTETITSSTSTEPSTPSASSTPKSSSKLWLSIIYVIGGLAALIFGGDLFVDNASEIACELGVSDAIVGLTIVAMGTSLPELATSVVAALKGKPGLCVGNVIGSNIFNAFLVLGVAGVAKPLSFCGITILDLSLLTVASLLFWLFGWYFGTRTINRAEGATLTLLYLAYITYLILTA